MGSKQLTVIGKQSSKDDPPSQWAKKCKGRPQNPVPAAEAGGMHRAALPDWAGQMWLSQRGLDPGS